MMWNLAPETDLASITNNGNSLRLLFKVNRYLSQVQLPFIHNERLHEAFVQAIQANRQQEALLSNNCHRINYPEVNKYFILATNGLNDSL